jgi:hypothetical protein
MMPHRSLSTEPPPGSKNAPRDRSTPPNPPSKDPGFTEIKQFYAQDPGSESPSEGIDPEATEPFPPDLFRLPVPNRMFTEMPSMGDAALRCLLALIHRSFRFDPEASEWTCPEKQFSRREIEAATGLSDQGTRDGLTELEEIGYAEINRAGRSYSYALRMGVPSQRYTYVPTALLEKAIDVPSGAALRVVLAVLRATWGWTSKCPSKEGGSGETAPQTVHKRWVELPNGDLADATGRSEPAVRRAAEALEGAWISRVRPGEGAHVYRILPSAFLPDDEGEKGGTGQDEEASSKPPTANESSPERQQSFPPFFSKESFSKEKQTGKSKPKTDLSPEHNRQETGGPGPAVPGSQNRTAENSTPDFSDLPDRKQSLAEKLTNAGIWPHRVRECLRRFSVGRVKANFRLWRARKNDPDAPEIKDDGAWLTAAIVEGYSNCHRGCPEGREEEKSTSSKERRTRRGEGTTRDSRQASSPNQLPDLPGHKEKVSARRKRALLRHREDTEPGQFHRFRHAESPEEKQFLYFDPATGGPSRRAVENREANEDKVTPEPGAAG